MTTGLVSTGLSGPRGQPSGQNERDAPAQALLENRGPVAEGEVEQVLHADDAGACRGVPELVEADVTQAHPGDQALVAGRHHRGQLVIKARVDPPAAGQAQVHRGELAGPQAAQVVLDGVAQSVRIAGPEDGAAAVGPDRDLADDRQPVGVGPERVADQAVDHAGAVVLGCVDVIDSGGDRGPEHTDGRCPVRRRPEGVRAGELHRTVPGPPDLHWAQGEG